jgi:hypothetical protein
MGMDADGLILLRERQFIEEVAETIRSNPELMELSLEYRRSRQTLEAASGNSERPQRPSRRR